MSCRRIADAASGVSVPRVTGAWGDWGGAVLQRRVADLQAQLALLNQRNADLLRQLAEREAQWGQDRLGLVSDLEQQKALFADQEVACSCSLPADPPSPQG